MTEHKYKRTRQRKPPPPPVTEAATEAAPTRRRRAKIGEHAQKLKVPKDLPKGYKYRWASAKPERLAELEELGYTVHADSSIPTSGLGSGTVQRPGGLGEDGSHYRHILMKTPDELYAQGREELETHNRKVDEAIRAGRDHTGQMAQGETYGSGSIKVDRG